MTTSHWVEIWGKKKRERKITPLNGQTSLAEAVFHPPHWNEDLTLELEDTS